jgi:hypothetical protein
MESTLYPPAYNIVEKMGDEVHVSKPDGLTYVIQNGLVIRTFTTTGAKVVPIVYLPMGSTYTHVVPPKPSAPPAEPEQLEALYQREQRMDRARDAMLKLVLYRRGMAAAKSLKAEASVEMTTIV